MTLATLRPDGWPQATTVGYVNDGLTLYFLCGLDSQEPANIARTTAYHLPSTTTPIRSWRSPACRLATRATAVTERAEARTRHRHDAAQVPSTEIRATGPHAQT